MTFHLLLNIAHKSLDREKMSPKNIHVSEILIYFHKICLDVIFNGRLLEFGLFHNFANSYAKLYDSTFYMKISKLQQKV